MIDYTDLQVHSFMLISADAVVEYKHMQLLVYNLDLPTNSTHTQLLLASWRNMRDVTSKIKEYIL